jgi:hypothetical protein
LFRIPGFIVVCILSTSSLWAQDGHYWTEHHGNSAIILNGAVIGSVADLGAVYYNPARMAHMKNPTFALSGKIFALDKLVIEDGAGEGADLRQTKFSGAPSMFAGTFQLNFLQNHFFAYSFLIRHHFSANYFVYQDDIRDIIDMWPGDEMFGGQLGFQKDLKEEWMGLSWAYPFSNTWSVGVSNFVAIRNQNEFIGRELQVYSAINELAMLEKTHKIGYNSLGLLWKISLAYDSPGFTAGLTITTPKIHLKGKGNTLYRDFYSGPKAVGDGKLKDTFISDQQSELDAVHKSPLAIGIGAGINFKKSKLHLSGEWFSSVAPYDNIAADPFIGQSNQLVYAFKMVEELNSVVNVGLGYEYHISDKYSVFSSIATDFSAVQPDVNHYPDNEEIAHGSLIKADIYHLGSGILIKAGVFEISTGATYAFANQVIDRPFNFPDEEGAITGDPGESELHMAGWKFILGFSFHLGNTGKKIEYK